MDGMNPIYRAGFIGALRSAPPLVINLLNTLLPVAARNQLNMLNVLKTGATTSFATGDDFSKNHGRGSTFTQLLLKNKFGNFFRFTDENGNQAYPSNYVIDHGTGLGWCKTLQTAAAWATAVGKYATFSLAVGPVTYRDFFLPNLSEQLSICTVGNGDMINYQPFFITLGGGSTLWTSTSRNTTSAPALQQEYQITNGAKTNSNPYLMARKHF